MQADDTSQPEVEQQQQQEPSSEQPVEAPEGDADDTSDAPQGEQTAAEKSRMVPHKAFHEERERRRQLERESAQQRQEWERRFQQLLDVHQQSAQQQRPQPQPGPQQPPLPDPDKDLPGYLVERINRSEAALREMAQILITERQQQAQQSQYQNAISQMETQAKMAESEYAREHPDYHDAANYLVEMRHKEMELAGIRDPAVRMQEIRNEAMHLAHRAMQEGRNPAEIIREMSILRGFKPKQAEQAAPGERVQQIAAGQQQARTLGNARGGAPNAINPQAIMAMSEKEFDTWMSKATDDQKKAVFGS